MDKRQAAAHLEYYGELGVAGWSLDREWRRRAGGPEPTQDGEIAAGGSMEADPADGTPVGGEGVVSLEAVQTELGECTRCKLSGLGRQRVVFGVGNPDAELMFVGEAPGRDEDAQGIPFVGRAGQLLNKIIESIGQSRESVYIANVIKCRPPQNRTPEPDEVATCEPFLFGQVDAIQPRVIVALGAFAARTLTRTDTPISRMRGREFEYRGAMLVPTFHPAYLLRNPGSKREVWEDMKKVRALLESNA
ncbi:MAG: uracil-DNA glycosylase [Vicinamibacterales bacterium]|nr:uracil-DNA glycosylase [Vicinamibacterales bacterium]